MFKGNLLLVVDQKPWIDTKSKCFLRLKFTVLDLSSLNHRRSDIRVPIGVPVGNWRSNVSRGRAFPLVFYIYGL